MALPISDDLRERIIRFYENNDNYSQSELAAEFEVCKSFIEKLLQRWRVASSSAALQHAGGRERTLKDQEATPDWGRFFQVDSKGLKDPENKEGKNP
ncbi:MAG: hypothetical protein M3X11_08920 [Acidobacteriota bacterium]|nr:hypothetical protein [Acidobacteriota bacterium]